MLRTGIVIWFTGLSGSGKTTLAHTVHDELKRNGHLVTILDGDQIRKAFPELGFSKEDRLANMQRVSVMARDLEAQGHVVLVALISPYNEGRMKARALCRRFKEVYLNTSLQVCLARDPKGLYKKALAGEIQNFTGISDAYEVPLQSDLVLNTEHLSVAECKEKILSLIKTT